MDHPDTNQGFIEHLRQRYKLPGQIISLRIDINHGELPTIECKFYPELTDGTKLSNMLDEATGMGTPIAPQRSPLKFNLSPGYKISFPQVLPPVSDDLEDIKVTYDEGPDES